MTTFSVNRKRFVNFETVLPAGVLAIGLVVVTVSFVKSQDPGVKEKSEVNVRGSIVEDRAARKLLEAGDARLDSGESAKAVEIWQSVIERYPRSRVRFDAHLRLGNHLLTKERAFDRARSHFEAVASEDNPDDNQRAEATLKIGVCHFENRNFGRCFKSMRDVIERFPVSPQVNQAYYYIGLGHFQEGHYSRAIAALERVGTALPPPQPGAEKSPEVLEAGKRLFVRIDDADLAALEPGKTVAATVITASGDQEIVQCLPLGRNVRVVIGSIPTMLGRPNPKNGVMEVKGGDLITIRYLDAHTADGKGGKEVTHQIPVVGTANLSIMDGAFVETLQGVVLGRVINLQVTDADFDLTDESDVVKATVEVYREKKPEELATLDAATAGEPLSQLAKNAIRFERYHKVDSLEIILKETKVTRSAGNVSQSAGATPDIQIPGELAPPPQESPSSSKKDSPASPSGENPTDNAKAPVNPKVQQIPSSDGPSKPDPNADHSVHSGIFRATVPLERSETANRDDDQLQALPNDIILVTYRDQQNAKGEPSTLYAKARCVEGSLGSVRVSETVISDEELRVRTQLKTASALTNIGNRYKEFGLRQNADQKYKQALALCEEVQAQARKLGGRTLEETYVQLWKIYFEMDNLPLAAAVSQRLQREFPNSEFVDAALISLGDVARKQRDYRRAIAVYNQVLALQQSSLRGEAQFGIAECYEELAKEARPESSPALFDRAFQEYKKVYDLYPDCGRVGEAVAKMANYYYQQKDYARAIDVFETVLRSHPDAKYLDVILFNYGRCLYRMDRKSEARKQFDQLIADFPESNLATDAKKVSEVLRKAGF